MKKHGSVQIEGMGECISLVAKLSQILSKNNFAVVKKMNSENVERSNSRAINPKLIVLLDKSKDFEKLTENIVIKA
jgi:hypothetical protein